MVSSTRILAYFQLSIAQGRAGWDSLRSGHPGRGWATALLTIWLFGLIGDGLTTHLALTTGVGVEANPGADFFFRLVGPNLWCAFGVLFIFFLALVTLSKPLHRVMIPLQVGFGIVLLVKLALTLNNSMVIWGYPAFMA